MSHNYGTMMLGIENRFMLRGKKKYVYYENYHFIQIEIYFTQLIIVFLLNSYLKALC